MPTIARMNTGMITATATRAGPDNPSPALFPLLALVSTAPELVVVTCVAVPLVVARSVVSGSMVDMTVKVIVDSLPLMRVTEVFTDSTTVGGG